MVFGISKLFTVYYEMVLLQRALSVDEMEALSAMAPEQRIMVMQFLNEIHEKRLMNDAKDNQSIWKLLSDKLQFNTRWVFEIFFPKSFSKKAILQALQKKK